MNDEYVGKWGLIEKSLDIKEKKYLKKFEKVFPKIKKSVQCNGERVKFSRMNFEN